MTTPEIKGGKFQWIKELEKRVGDNNYVKRMKKLCR